MCICLSSSVAVAMFFYVIYIIHNIYQVKSSPIPSSSGIRSLSGIIDKIQYKSIVQYLPYTMGLDIKDFEGSEYGFQYYLDDTFLEYCDLSCDELKAKVLQELQSNSVWYTKTSAACLGMRGIKFDAWLKKLSCPCT